MSTLKVGDWVVMKEPYTFMDGTTHPDLHICPRRIESTNNHWKEIEGRGLMFVNFQNHGHWDSFSFFNNDFGTWVKVSYPFQYERVTARLP